MNKTIKAFEYKLDYPINRLVFLCDLNKDHFLSDCELYNPIARNEIRISNNKLTELFNLIVDKLETNIKLVKITTIFDGFILERVEFEYFIYLNKYNVYEKINNFCYLINKDSPEEKSLFKPEKRIKNGMPPMHPGVILREEFIDPLGISPEELAKQMNMQVDIIRGVLFDNKPVNKEIAIGLSKVFNNTVEFWLNLQNSFDLKIAELNFKPS